MKFTITPQRDTPLRKTAALALACITALAAFLATAATVRAQTDNFNSSSGPNVPTGWTASALPLYGAPTYSFPSDGSGGKAFRISAPPTGTDPYGLGPARAGAFRTDVQYTGRFSVRADLLAWNATWNQFAGLLFYLQNPGLGSSDGYIATYSSDDKTLYLSYLADEKPHDVGSLADGAVVLAPTHQYRLVASSHDGYTFLFQVFDKSQPTNALASVISEDYTYYGFSGYSGFLIAESDYPSDTEGADATFDNYVAAVPATMPATVTDLSPPPAGKATAAYPTVSVGIMNRDTAVDPSSIRLYLDGVQIPNGSLTIDPDWVYKPNNPYYNGQSFLGATVTYAIPTLYPLGSQHTNMVAFMDSTSTWQTNTWTWTTAYPYLWATNSLPTDSLSLRGFNARLVQSSAANIGGSGGLPNRVTSAQAVLNNQYAVDLAATNMVQSVAWDLTPPGSYGAVANFPGLGGATTSFAMQTTAYLQLTAGLHRFYVDSDDVVGIYSGTNLTDTSTVLMETNGLGHQSFDFIVAVDGLYPFNIIYEQGTGLAFLVLRSVNLADNSQTLLNAPGGIPAFYSPAPPTITSQPESLTNLLGTTVAFNVAATDTAPLSYQWQFKGADLTDSTHITGTRSSSLTVLNILASDAGDYQVVVTNLSPRA